MLNKKEKAIIVFLESDNFYECNIVSKNSLPKFMNNNILINSKIKSFSVNSCDVHELVNCDIYFIFSIIEYLMNKYGIYPIVRDKTINIIEENKLKSSFNGYIPNIYKRLKVETSLMENYYIKIMDNVSMLKTLLNVCKIYDIQFSINIELQNYCYNRITILFDEI